MKPIDAKTNTYIDFAVEKNDKDPRFKVVDYIRVSNCKNISDFNHNEIVGIFCEKEIQKTNQTELKVEKLIKKKKYEKYVNSIYIYVYVKPGCIGVDRQTVN